MTIRSILKQTFIRSKIPKRTSISYCVNNNLLPELLVRTPSHKLRENFNLPYSEHSSQLNQDIFALLINRFQPGFFVEIGANDGYTLSNSIYLESCFNWQGILIEANPKYLDSLNQRKQSIIVNKAVASKKGKKEFIDAGLFGGLKESLDPLHQNYTNQQPVFSVECEPLYEILKACDAPQCIDFVSLDVEGGECAIVEQMVKGPYRFKCGCIEHNNRRKDYDSISSMLNSANYKIIWKGQTSQDLFFIDATL